MAFNVLLVGKTGSGKSWVGMQMSKFLEGHVVVVDGENSCETYRDRFDFRYPMKDGVELKLCESMMEAHAIVKDLLDSPSVYGPCKLLFMDGLSPWWNNLQDQVEAFKAQKKGKNPFESGLDQDGWTVINRNWRRFIFDLRRLEIPRICTAWMKEEWEGTGNNRKRVGWMANAQKDLEHEFHLVLHLNRTGNTYSAVVSKSRYDALAQGDVVTDNIWEVLQNVWPEVWEKSAQARPRPTEEQIDRFSTLVNKFKISHDQLRAGFSKYGVSQFDELQPDNATILVGNLEKFCEKQNPLLYKQIAENPQVI